MSSELKIDFVSDVSCPWCAIGLASLEEALRRLDGEVRPLLRFQPFELNPAMPPGGQDIGEHLTGKYGTTPEQQAASREAIRQRGAAAWVRVPQGRARPRLQHLQCAPPAALGRAGGAASVSTR